MYSIHIIIAASSIPPPIILSLLKTFSPLFSSCLGYFMRIVVMFVFLVLSAMVLLAVIGVGVESVACYHGYLWVSL